MSIILKRGTEANRSGLSLKTGEPIFTTDTRRLYIGSGSSSAGNEIEFGQLSASFVSASTISATNVTVDTLTAKNPINTTCSYSQTASYLLGSVESASYVDYANVGNKPSLVSSSAQFKSSDNVTFGQVTASVIEVQTLHVQTITSSVDYVTGSTIHGSQQSNTHQFTGSILATGSLFVNGHDIGTSAARTIVGTTDQVIVANGDGIAGNPTLSLPQSIATSSKPIFAGATLATGPTQFATALDIQESTHATSRRAGLNLGKWMFFQDPGGVGTRSFCLYDSLQGMQRLIVNTSGNVGVNNTNPLRKLDVVGDVNGNGIRVTGTSGTIGAFTAEGTSVNIQADSAAATRVLVDAGTLNASGYAVMNGGSSGYVQLGTGGTPKLQVFASGIVKLNNYGAGTLVTDSSGNITATSDGRMKDISGSFDRGLDAIINLSPKVYHWNKESGLNTEDVNVGLIAQEVLPYIPEAVSCKDDKYTMSDRPIIAALINAVKELKADNDQLRARIDSLES
jgi:hypothetical protein